MRFRGSRIVAEPTLGTGLVPIRNRPGEYIRVPWEEAKRFKGYELYEQPGGLVVQNILKKRVTLEQFMPGTWVRVGFTDHIE